MFFKMLFFFTNLSEGNFLYCPNFLSAHKLVYESLNLTIMDDPAFCKMYSSCVV